MKLKLKLCAIALLGIMTFLSITTLSAVTTTIIIEGTGQPWAKQTADGIVYECKDTSTKKCVIKIQPAALQ
jgi:hypothetical protein